MVGQAVANCFQNGNRLPFWIFRNLNCNGHNGPIYLRRPICVIMPNFVAIGQTFAEMWQFCDFENHSLLPSAIF